MHGFWQCIRRDQRACAANQCCQIGLLSRVYATARCKCGVFLNNVDCTSCAVTVTVAKIRHCRVVQGSTVLDYSETERSEKNGVNRIMPAGLGCSAGHPQRCLHAKRCHRHAETTIDTVIGMWHHRLLPLTLPSIRHILFNTPPQKHVRA